MSDVSTIQWPVSPSPHTHRNVLESGGKQTNEEKDWGRYLVEKGFQGIHGSVVWQNVEKVRVGCDNERSSVCAVGATEVGTEDTEYGIR